jgi:uncharacterized protein (DUF2141 family)
MKNLSKLTPLLVLAMSLGTTGTALGDTKDAIALDVVIQGVRSDAGELLTVLCTKDEVFPVDCKRKQTVKANKGMVTVSFNDLPKDTYAFALFHDENSNTRIDMAPNYIPLEGLAFGNDAMGRTGSPNFEQSAFQLDADAKKLVTMRYLTQPQ